VKGDNLRMPPPGPPNNTHGTTPVLLTRDLLGDVNRSRIVQAFCDHGRLSRADLARLAGVPRATIGAIIQGLLDDGLLEELAPDRTSGRVGKPARPLWFGRDAGRSAAVVFDAEGVRSALVNARGDRLADARVDVAVHDAAPEQLLDAVIQAVEQVVPRRGRHQLLGVGVAVPGVCDTAAGVVVASAQIPAAEGDRLTHALSSAVGLPVLVDNDARVQALGEKWFGDGRGLPTFASVQTGAGLGVGLVLGGHLYRGDDGRTGELGHTRAVPGGEPCNCGLTGCWETVATLGWLRREARARGLAQPRRIDSAALVAAMDAGEGGARELLDDYAANLAFGLCILVNVLGIRHFLMHGDVVRGGEQLRSRVETATRAGSLGHLADAVSVQMSALDADAGLLGAAGLVLSDTFTLSV
jgi:predicted NBD/HSP70 family sugar kinase